MTFARTASASSNVCPNRCSGSTGGRYPVEVAQGLRDLADEVDRRLLRPGAELRRIDREPL